jgi:hypothetical protein
MSYGDFGDYVCPNCRYKSLRRNANICPLCHVYPGLEFWRQVDSEEQARGRAATEAAAKERRREIQAAEEWKRGEPARAVAKRRQEAGHRATFIIGCYLGYFYPILFWSIGHYLYSESVGSKVATNGWELVFVPLLNLILCLGAFSSEFAFMGFLISGLIALVMWGLLRGISSAVLAWLVGVSFGVATVLYGLSRGGALWKLLRFFIPG